MEKERIKHQNKQNDSKLFQIFLVVLTVLLTLIGNSVYQQFQSRTQNKVRLVGKYQKFELPSNIKTERKGYNTAIDPDSLEKAIPQLKGLRDKDYSNISFKLYTYMRDLTLPEVIDKTNQYNSLWFFSVVNNGGNKIENLSLSIPFGGFYEVLNNESEIFKSGYATNFSGNKIDLGEIKPTEVMTVKVWSEKNAYLIDGLPYFSNDGERPKLIFDNGSVFAEFTTK